jgi:hypothetical protein
MFDYSKLIGRIIEKFRTQSAFAAAMQLSANTWSKKINGYIDFKAGEIRKAVRLLGLTPGDIPKYFFTDKV